MKTKILLTINLLSIVLSVNAQKNINLKYNAPVLENDDVKITTNSAGSTEDFFKMKFDITNKTKDYFLFRTVLILPCVSICQNTVAPFQCFEVAIK